ncbi:hypothetical protein [Streptomyces sp. NBC_01320]|nr:hypothetical protein OG395_08635 [Streptomyces sp. NBC_01320]
MVEGDDWRRAFKKAAGAVFLHLAVRDGIREGASGANPMRSKPPSKE